MFGLEKEKLFGLRKNTCKQTNKQSSKNFLWIQDGSVLELEWITVNRKLHY